MARNVTFRTEQTDDAEADRLNDRPHLLHKRNGGLDIWEGDGSKVK